MNNKKISVLFFSLFLLMILINLGFTSAQFAQEFGRGFQEVYNIINILIDNFLTPFVQLVLTSQGDYISNDMLFAKLLFFVIVLGMVHFALRRVSFFEQQNKALYGIIVFAVSVLATRWLGTKSLIQTIILPYSTLGVAISAGLPFIIYFLMIDIGFKNTPENDYSILRKFAWVLFIVIFIGLWFSRTEIINQSGGYGYIYTVTLIASVGVLLFDGTISRVWAKAELNRTMYSMASKTAREMKRELSKLYEDLGRVDRNSTDWWAIKRQIEEMQKQIAELLKGKI